MSDLMQVMRRHISRVGSLLFTVLAGFVLASCSNSSTSFTPQDPGFTTSTSPFASALTTGAELKALVTVGDVLPGSSDPWPSIPDGLGAFMSDGNLVVFSNHELSPAGVETSTGGSAFNNGRVSRLVLNKDTLGVLSASYPVNGSEGYSRFCASSWADGIEGLPSGYFLTGEEAGPTEKGSITLAVKGDGSGFTELPWLGAISHETAQAVPYPGKVVVFGTDDSRGQSELYMYVGNTEADLLAGTGKLFVFTTTEATHAGNLTVGQTVTGSFVEITDPADLGTAPLDRYPNLQAKADALGAFPFVRLEDLDYDRRAGASPAIYFVDTGSSSVTGRPEVGATCTTGVCDEFGSIYRMELDTTDPTQNAKLILLGRSTGTGSWASPDNIGTSSISLMVQEDPAVDGFGRNPRIWNFPIQGDGTLGAPTPIVELTNPECAASDNCDESSGIISLETLLGAGKWLFNIQGHSKPVESLSLIEENGQLLYLNAPGT